MTRPFRASVDVSEVPKAAEFTRWITDGHESRVHVVGRMEVMQDWTACGLLVPEFATYVAKAMPLDICVQCLRKLKRENR